jgi:DeoR/GlpR family transcriptional regulator of sugar metabolism
VIHTNSYQIVDAIAQSALHCMNIRVRVIGGELKMGLKSVSGVLSSSCLDAWGLRGDLAVVGATGVSDYLGQPTLFCDNLEESHLKGRFLDACWVKVALFDSSKIGKGTVNQAFCAVSPGSLDLIVTDDGIHSGNADKVRQLKEKALATGVSFLIAKSAK